LEGLVHVTAASDGRAYVLVVLEPTHRVHYDMPPLDGLDARICATRECFPVELMVLVGERALEIPLPDGVWFFEDLEAARRSAREWLARLSRSQAAGGRATVRHAEVLVNPASDRATSQLAGLAPILDIFELEDATPAGTWGLTAASLTRSEQVGCPTRPSSAQTVARCHWLGARAEG
jgi:hypothetical protein